MILAIVVWVAVALACYLLLRRVSYNVLDPVIVLTLFISFSAALLVTLCDTGLVSWNKFLLFNLVLAGYLGGACIAGTFFHRERFHRLILDTLASVRNSETTVIVVCTAAVTLVLAALALQMGAEGDARQAFGRLFRPIVLLQSGLFQLSMVLLASPKFAMPKAVLCLLVLAGLSIPFSGKSIFVPILFWFGLRLFITRGRVTLKALTLLGLVAVAGVVIMAVFAYGSETLEEALLLLGSRLWLSGDTYIYAYRGDTLESLRSSYDVSFVSYMLHPLSSLIGIRAYDKPLGAAMASEVNGTDTLTGPNPHLPVVFDYFFPDQLGVSLLLAFVIGFLVMSLRPLCLTLVSNRSRYAKLGGITAAVFCPAAGFQDTSQVLIGLVGVVAAAAFGATLELLFAKQARAPDLKQPDA